MLLSLKFKFSLLPLLLFKYGLLGVPLQSMCFLVVLSCLFSLECISPDLFFTSIDLLQFTSQFANDLEHLCLDLSAKHMLDSISQVSLGLTYDTHIDI